MHPSSFFAVAAAAGRGQDETPASSTYSPSPVHRAGSTDAPSPFFSPGTLSADMPPSYEAVASASSTLALPKSPTLCPPSPKPSMAGPSSPAPSFSASVGFTRRAPPSPIPAPPPYVSSPPPQSPICPVSLDELDADPHYLATPTQRSYFVQLSDLFETEAQSNEEPEPSTAQEMREKSVKREKRASMSAPVLRRSSRSHGAAEPRTPSCFGFCTIS